MGLVGVMAVVAVACMAIDSVFGQSPAGGTATPGASLQQLAAAARAAKSQARPLTEADARQALARLTAAVGELNVRLAAAGPNGEDWKKYLLWDKLQAQLQRPQPDMEVLGAVFGRLSAGHEGLELRWFVRTRQALQQYLALAGAVGNAAVKGEVTARLDRLAQQLEACAAHPTTETLDQIAELTAWLDNAKQVPELVQSVRACFGRPNFHTRIGGTVLAAGVGGPVDETEPISDVILGTFVQGTGRTIGRTESRLVPNSDCGVFDAVLLATNYSTSVGSHAPVCIYSNGTSGIGACKRFWVDEAGLHAYPAVSQVQTNSQITDIRDQKGRGLVEKIAWKKALKQESLADAIASQHAAARVNARVDEEAAEPLEKAATNYQTKIRGPLADRLAFPRRLGFASTADGILSTGWQFAADQLAAPNDAPDISVACDLSVRVHESAVNNLAATVLSGMELRKDMFQAAVTDLVGRVPDRFKDEQDEEPWTIVFDRQRPLTVTFADDTLSLTVRGIGYYFRGEKNPYPATNIKAVYKFVKTAQGFKAVRQGGLEFLPPDFVKGVSKLNPRQESLYTILQRKVGKALQPELVPEGFTLTGKLASVGKFVPVELSCRDGWLLIGWRRTPAPPANATAAAQ
jgi:hypothetical protein